MMEDTKNTVGSTEVVENNLESNVVSEAIEKAQARTAEEFQALQQRMLEEATKKIAVAPLSPALHSRLAAAVAQLEDLKKEIAEKRQGTLERKAIIRDRLDRLKSSGHVNVDEPEFERTDVSVHNYVELLERMIEEVAADEQFYLSLLSDNPPAEMAVFRESTLTFEQVIEQRIQAIKRYVKNAKRDLAVSFSRYCFGFDNQIRQILYVEHVLQDAQVRK